MIARLDTINLHKGATTIVNFDLSNFDLEDGYVELNIKEMKTNKLIKTAKLETKGINQIIFTDEFTKDLKVSSGNYYYDLMWVLKGERFPQCLPSLVIVNETVGGLE